jgi:predicted transcriptional regulator
MSDQPTPAPAEPQVKLVDVEVTNEIVALNLMVSFLNLAQRRGIYSIDESAKIWECIKKFQKASSDSTA